MTNSELIETYNQVRNKKYNDYLILSRQNANTYLALKNLFNSDSPNLTILCNLMEKYLFTRQEIQFCLNAVERMDMNISYTKRLAK